MTAQYSTDSMAARIKLKSYIGTSSSLTPQEIVDLLNDSLRSYIVPIMKTIREEFWVGKNDLQVTVGSDGSIDLPDSVASTLRTVFWNQNSTLNPLSRIEPEVAYQYLNQNAQGFTAGFMLRGNTLITLPKSPGTILSLTAMFRPSEMVLSENAAEVDSVSGGNSFVLDLVPIEWPGDVPTKVDIIAATSPNATVYQDVPVVSLSSSTLTLSLTDEQVNKVADKMATGGLWIALPGQSPFASLPVDLCPLLELDVVNVLFAATGDKRGAVMMKKQETMEDNIRRTMVVRTQGQSRPIVNLDGPGMNRRGGWNGGRF